MFHGDDGEPDYLFYGWNQSSDEPCDCGLFDPFAETINTEAVNQ